MYIDLEGVMKLEDNTGKVLMVNADENRNQLVEDLKKKIEELEDIITDISSEENKTISTCLEKAQQKDVNYVPNRDVVQELLKLKDDLAIVQEKLQNLNLTEDTIFDEDKYLIKAEELMEKVDSVIEKKIRGFKRLNEKRLEEALNKKIEIQIGISNSEIELNHVNLDKEELEEQIAEIENGIIYRIRSSIFNKKGSSETEGINSKIAELDKRKRELEVKISKLKMQEQAEHFVPSTTPQANDDQIMSKKEKEDLNQEK